MNRIIILVIALVSVACNNSICEWNSEAFEVTPDMLPANMLDNECIALVAPDGTGFYDLDDAGTCTTEENPYECVIVHPSRVSEVGWYKGPDATASHPMLVPRGIKCVRYECAELRNMITGAQ